MAQLVRSLFVPVCSLVLLAGLAACGGNEPVVQAPAPTTEPTEDEAPQMGVSAEIGGLSEDKVDKTFQKALPDFQRCLDDGAKRVEYLGGSVSFFVKIDVKGRVDHAHLE